jgi:hypothetical protein
VSLYKKISFSEQGEGNGLMALAAKKVNLISMQSDEIPE